MHTEGPETRSAGLPGLGRYVLLEQLGRGGMGTVYLAQDTKLDRKVAVKILPPHSVNDAGAVARFQREARALAQLSHPGIVQAYDSDAADDRHFLVMEYVEGPSLAQVLKERGALPPAEAADYVHQAALALGHAHAKGLVHRDLKPSNLLLTREGRVKLLDLGLARFLQDQIAEPSLTRDGTGVGTPDYASPEQFRNAHEADARSDIYSLGCTLYHLLAGQVPFPGSSLDEKYTSHQHRAPPPLEQLCPQAPLGLIVVAQRMMAKKPADRYQTAQAVADALAPFVGASSVSLEALKNTLTWQANKSTMAMLSPRRRLLPWLGGALVGVAAMLAVLYFVWPPPGEPVGAALQGVPGDTKGGPVALKDTPRVPEPKGRSKTAAIGSDDVGAARAVPEEVANAPDFSDPDVLTVAQDGSAQFKTIKEALTAVQPGQTIRVLDDKEYAESILLNRPAAYRGVTVEAVRGARLVSTADDVPVITIRGTAGLTIRGFRLRAVHERVILIGVAGACPGLVLEHLEFGPSIASTTGIEIYNMALAAEDPPAVIRHCTLRELGGHLLVFGTSDTGREAGVSRRIVIQENTFSGGRGAVGLYAHVEQVQVVGNRISGMDNAGIHLQQLTTEARDILLANNTTLGCNHGVRLWDSAVKGQNIRLCNNLFLDCPAPDIYFVESPDGNKFQGAGDGMLVAKVWDLECNWREVTGPTAKGKPTPGRVPLGPSDKEVKSLEKIERNPRSPDFLRPFADSPLTGAGAGKTDPSLPLYVGALPPRGSPPWDWSRTWQVPPPGVLLTVSKNPEGGGKYRTLNDALKDAKPWATIRIVDGETYEERVVLDDVAKHRGLQIESTAATILLKGQGWVIEDVPDVRLRGLHLQAAGLGDATPLLWVRGLASGVVLEDLTLRQAQQKRSHGVVLDQVRLVPHAAPVVVRRCKLAVPLDGITVSGGADNTEDSFGGVVIHDNAIAGGFRGIYLRGKLTGIQVTHNRLWGLQAAAVQLEGRGAFARDFLVAHNTMYDVAAGWRLWHAGPADPVPARLMLINNLVYKTVHGDLVCYQETTPGAGNRDSKLAGAFSRAWQMAGNWRDPTGEAVGRPLLSALDHRLTSKPFTATEPTAPGFLQPTAELFVLMATPAPDWPWQPYGGAVPPPGSEVPEWERYRVWR
jgi:serine/threonine protein kinase